MTRYALAFFDVDSTLVTIEGIDFLAADEPRIAELTEAAMSGRLPLEDVYAKRLALVRPSRRKVDQLAQAYLDHITPGAEEVIAELRSRCVDVQLVTAGLEPAILPLAEHFGLSPRAVHAVPLQFDRKGTYLDFERNSPLTRAGGKETVVLDARARSHGRALLVGDGVSDLEARNAVDLFVGFGGIRKRERVQREADVFIENLAQLLPIVFEGEGDLRRLTRKR